MGYAARLDHACPPRFFPGMWLGPPFFLVLTVLGFFLWWPVGLALLAFFFWSRTMGCGHHGRARFWGHHAMERFCGERRGPTGNRAFDAYREETLRRLEQDQRDFAAFLDHLRNAKDKAEFDQFMADRERWRQQRQGDEGAPPAQA